MSMKETLIKTAEQLRKLAQEIEEAKMQKCAKILLSATALSMLKSKIKG